MKKFISVLLSVIMLMSVLSVGAYAATTKPNAPMYESSNTIYSLLTIKNSTATCKTTVLLADGEKWESITQTLEKQSSSGKWSQACDPWTTTASGSSRTCIFSNTATLSTSGKYRVKSVIVVETSSKNKETITTYSSEVSM
ncbi:MAG: hypothetical protein HDT47_05355 [Ruminococcaceae bacterium]|nr:hypothetical protein [Oscillospiraceae bacterium]